MPKQPGHNSGRPFRLVGLAIIAIAWLSGCGGSGGDNPEVEPPPAEPIQLGGIWRGTTSANIESSLLEDEQIVIYTTDAGDFRLVSDSAVQAAGFIEVETAIVPLTSASSDSETLIGNITAFAPQGAIFSDGATTSACTLRATINEAASITGTYTCENPADNGEFSVAYDADLYEQPASVDLVQGTWSGLDFATTNNNVVLEFTVDADDGNFTGSNSEGCQLTNGNIDPVDPDFNMYNIAYQLEFCAELNGNYSGLGRLRPADAVTTTDELAYQIDNGIYILTQPVFQ